MTMKKKVIFGIAALIVLSGAVAALRIVSYAPVSAAAIGAGTEAHGFPWRGAIHVHSSISDGAAGIDEIMAAAGEAGVDFLVLTDHNPLGPRERPRPGWYGDVLLIVAEEITTDQGHLLALQIPPHRYRFGPTARQALADINDEGGWALVAHPHHSRQAWAGGWGGTQGLEVVNLSSAWSRSTALSRAATVVSAIINRDYAATRLLSGGWPTVSLWDSLTELSGRRLSVSRPRVVVGAADAHGPLLGPLPSYAYTLGVLSTLVWIDEPAGRPTRPAAERVESKLLAALRGGHAAIETTALGDGRSFVFTARSPNTLAKPGELVGWEDGPWTLQVEFESTGDTEIVVLRDGHRIAQAAATSIAIDVDEPGTYRVEVYRGAATDEEESALPWIVSNPIYLWPAEARTAARLFRVPPLPVPPSAHDLLAGAAFEANDRGVPYNMVESRGTEVSWSFALNAASDPEAFAAMIWRADEAMDWSKEDGLIVEIQAGHAMRAALELQTIAADSSLKSWVYSVKAGPDTEAVAIPWSRFRPSGPEGLIAGAVADAERPSATDMRRVENVILLVTPLLLAQGSSATLKLRALALYGSQ